jgi:long-chain acyl-CoA synthetase
MIVTIIGMHSDEPGVAVIQRWFNAAEWVALCEQHRSQRTALVPAMVQMLLAEPLEDATLDSLLYVSSGAAPLSVDVLREFERRVPSCQVLEGYGCTETSAVISTNPPLRRRVGSVGLPIADCEVRIVGERDDTLRDSDDGEICVRGPGIMSGYWNAPEETATVLRDGWLHTGDIGHVDADGYLYLTDRKAFMIISGGVNIYPREVEDALALHPAVFDVAVIGVADPDFGEAVTAVVVAAPGHLLREEDIIRALKEEMAGFKVPKRVYLVDDLPRNPMGKIEKKVLRERYSPN